MDEARFALRPVGGLFAASGRIGSGFYSLGAHFPGVALGMFLPNHVPANIGVVVAHTASALAGGCLRLGRRADA